MATNDIGFFKDGAGTARFMLQYSTGNVGIGTTTPTAQLSNTGTVRFAALGSGGAGLITDSLGNVTVSSDERLKDIQGEYKSGLESVLKINPIVYKWKTETGYDSSGIYAGFSAQNIQSAIPEAVTVDQRGFLTLADRPILASIVNAIKELTSMVIEKVPTWFASKNDAFCVDDVCVTKEEFKSMLLKSKTTNTPVMSAPVVSTPTPTETTSTTTPEVVETPPEQPTEPTPIIETVPPTPEPTPVAEPAPVVTETSPQE
jgi:cell division septation protein DedD